MELFRCFDPAGVLVYAGVSQSTVSRVRFIRAREPWGKRIATYTVVQYSGEKPARKALARVWRDECPLFHLLGYQLEAQKRKRSSDPKFQTVDHVVLWDNRRRKLSQPVVVRAGVAPEVVKDLAMQQYRRDVADRKKRFSPTK